MDIGAEKGAFAASCFTFGFEQGILFEPLPEHLSELSKRNFGSKALVYPYAIDAIDGFRPFHIAFDKEGQKMNYFHSIHRISNHKFFRHDHHIMVECRSLESLLQSGEIDGSIGLLKIDTEGNELRVLKGMGLMRPELILCEFVPPGVYPD